MSGRLDSPSLSRDLGSARDAFDTGDAEASRLAHSQKSVQPDHKMHGKEKHKSAGEYIKSAIYGGLDGILAMFACVAGVEGGSLSARVLIVLGFAALIADALSMGVGDALSTYAENEYANRERARERWECENYLDGEKREMVELYMSKGLSQEDAQIIVDILSQDKDVFIDFMMVEELGIMPEEEGGSPIKNGLVTFVSFIICGSVPLVSSVIARAALSPEAPAYAAFIIACAATAVALFVLGAVKARYTHQRWYLSGLTTLLLGGVAAAAAYGVGVGVHAMLAR